MQREHDRKEREKERKRGRDGALDEKDDAESKVGGSRDKKQEGWKKGKGVITGVR